MDDEPLIGYVKIIILSGYVYIYLCSNEVWL